MHGMSLRVPVLLSDGRNNHGTTNNEINRHKNKSLESKGKKRESGNKPCTTSKEDKETVSQSRQEIEAFGVFAWMCSHKGKASHLVPGRRKEQVLPLVQPQYGSLEAMQFLKEKRRKINYLNLKD